MARIAYVIARDADLAQDAVQAARTMAWRQLGKLRDPQRLRPWLMSIAANEAKRLVRRRHRRFVTEIAIPETAGTVVQAVAVDPATGASEVIGTLPGISGCRRPEAGVTPLDDGSVLVAGGVGMGPVVLDTASLIEPGDAPA